MFNAWCIFAVEFWFRHLEIHNSKLPTSNYFASDFFRPLPEAVRLHGRLVQQRTLPLWPFGVGGLAMIGNETIVVIDPHFGSRFIRLENHPKKYNLLYLSCFFQAFFLRCKLIDLICGWGWLGWWSANYGPSWNLGFRWWSSQQWPNSWSQGSLSSGKTWHLYCEVVATTGACWRVEGCEDWQVEVGLSISQNVFLFFGCIYVALCFRR